MPPLLADKKAFGFEYHRKKLLAEISRDRQRVLKRLERLEAETRKNRMKQELSTKDELAWRKSECELDMALERHFQEILKESQPAQARALMGHREQERKRSKERAR